MDDTPVINELKEALCYCSMEFESDLKRYHSDRQQRKHWILPDFVRTFEGRCREDDMEDEGEAQTDAQQSARQDNDEQALEMGVEMVTVPEVMFHPSDIGINQAGIAETIVQTVEACPEELSGAFYANILLVGGNTKFKNFRQRLERDLRPLVSDDFDIGLHEPSENMQQRSMSFKVRVGAVEAPKFPIVDRQRVQQTWGISGNEALEKLRVATPGLTYVSIAPPAFFDEVAQAQGCSSDQLVAVARVSSDAHDLLERVDVLAQGSNRLLIGFDPRPPRGWPVEEPVESGKHLLTEIFVREASELRNLGAFGGGSLVVSDCEQGRILVNDRPYGKLKLAFEEVECSAATKISQNQDEVVEEENPILVSDLPCISSIWEDEELLSHCVDYDAIVKEEKLAAGANGEVWRAMHRSQEVVVKNLLGEVMTGSKSPTSSNANEVTAVYRRRRAILNFVEEIRIMSRLEHNRIVEFRGVAVSAERGLLLVMEYLPRGDLRTFLNTVKRNGDNSTSSSGGSSGQYLSIWTWTKSQWRLAIDIIEGLVYLHSLNPPLVHGDLKSANVLLRSNLRAKLTDFGLSRYLLSEDECLGSVDTTTASEENPTTSSSSRYGSRARGTGRWMAPELLTSGAQSSMASDVYAFGIVLSEIDTCELPFTEREKLVARSHTSHTASAGEDSSEDSDSRLLNESMIVHKIVAEGWKPTFRVTCPEVIKKLAQECLLPDPNARPTSLAVAHRLRKAATKRERPEALAAQAKATTSLRIR
ncbi:DmX protein 1 [Phytophthora nicotianae]|uniref:DmX protein 1 n=1 Tax=Phytophthora nicotianae TaxID=4792 RepID=A0A0W8DNS8_PHYNI|nr:DmX protein 1 [Phytophthora nicotianae]